MACTDSHVSEQPPPNRISIANNPFYTQYLSPGISQSRFKYVPKMVVEEQVLRAIFEGRQVKIKKRWYRCLYYNTEEFFKPSGLGETYYEIPILEQSIYDYRPRTQGPLRAIFNGCGDIIGVIFHPDTRKGSKLALEYVRPRYWEWHAASGQWAFLAPNGQLVSFAPP
jgi:hypothetical protein